MVSALIEYEAWGLTQPTVPPRSRLYSLEPLGLGTSSVESLTSYITRLAVAHCVSVGSLYHREIIPLKGGSRNIFSLVRTQRTGCHTSSINGAGSMASRFTHALEILTGRKDLQYLTMLPWREAFHRNSLTRRTASWCPRCWTEWRDLAKPVYIPLLWALAVVKICTRHNLPLQSICLHCGHLQGHLHQRVLLGYCIRCRRWLGSPLTGNVSDHQTLTDEEWRWQAWVAHNMGDLIAAPSHVSAILNQGQVRQRISHAMKLLAAPAPGAFARLIDVNPVSIYGWRNGDELPSVPALLLIVYCLGTSLLNFLAGEGGATNGFTTLPKIPPWRVARAHNKISFKPANARRSLQQTLSESPPQSLTAVIRRKKLHLYTVRKHFPDLCVAITIRFAEYTKNRSARIHADRQAEFRRVACELQLQGVKLCVNRVRKCLAVRFYISQQQARAIIKEVHSEASKQQTVPGVTEPADHP